MGYREAGFEVIGIDIKPMPRYPFEFHQADALAYLDAMLLYGWQDIDAIHASPPCQGYSVTQSLPYSKPYPQLVESVRERLEAIGLPYVIENVPRAPLLNPVTLCGSQFGLVTDWPPWGKVALRRHRLFEAGGFAIADAGPHDHSLYAVPVYGHGPGLSKARRHRPYPHGHGALQAAREVMQIDWMTRDELDESIPPAYTRYIGKQLLEAVSYNWSARLAA